MWWRARRRGGDAEALGGGVDLFSMRCKLNREEMYTVSALENGRSISGKESTCVCACMPIGRFPGELR